MQKIYLDNGASTRVADEVIETMLPYFSEHYGNPSNSMHCFGEEAMHEIQNATTTILEHFNSVRHGTLIYTSGASEANNLAIKGILQKAEKPCHIITSPFEHDSVLNAILSCANQNVSYSFVQVDTDGIIDLDDLEKKIQPNTRLISIISANNEIGTIQPLKKICEIAHSHGIIFHSDATQYIATEVLDLNITPIDLISFSAHKIYGPKGIGGLLINDKNFSIDLIPQIHGGGQQKGLRSGTLNVPGIIGMAKAFELLKKNALRDKEKQKALFDRFLTTFKNSQIEFCLNGSADNRIVSNINLYFCGISSIALLSKMPNVAISTGSACSSNNMSPSRTISAISNDLHRNSNSIRITTGRYNTIQEIDYVAQKIIESVTEIKSKEA